jgi:amino acid adenylation domain-containing protein
MPHENLTLQSLLSDASAKQHGGVTCVDASATETTFTYAELLLAARRALTGLREAGFRQGDPVPLLVARGASFLPAFWGCALGGLAPVPLAPPSSRGDSDEVRKLTAVWARLDNPRVVCEPILTPVLGQLLGPNIAVSVDRVIESPPADDLATVRPGDLALIQFSSGSTGDPKGVMLSHRSLVTNARQIAARVPLTRDQVELGWMPLYHDMGLIACHLAPMFAQVSQVRIDTLAFLKKPSLWFEMATRHRATILSGTNTALRLALRRIPSPNPSWDLSAVRAVIVGAEPVSPTVFRDFLDRFASVGLQPNTARVAYGLAEASVGVAITEPTPSLEVHTLRRTHLSVGSNIQPLQPDHPDALAVVGVGPALDDTNLRIVDDDDKPLPDEVVGHVQAIGPQLFQGYFKDEGATRKARCDAWLRTGDLGFLHQGRLVLCGRVKDLIFAGGRNVYAHDVELAAMQAPDVHAAVACAIPAPDGTHEQTLLFVVVSDFAAARTSEVLEGARLGVLRNVRIPIDWVIPIDHHAIPRTSSGKVRRYRLGERFVAGVFSEVAVRATPTIPRAPGTRTAPHEMEVTVATAWSSVLGIPIDGIGLDVPFSDLGGGSVEAQDVLGHLEDALNRPLGQDLLLQCSTVREMASFLRSGGAPKPRSIARAHPVETGEIAVVSMACRLPSSPSPEAFWANLVRGFDAVQEIPPDRFSAPDSLRCRWGAFLDDPYRFDPEFFHIDPAEARVMDPQQRLLLEVAVECFERAGLGGSRKGNATVGVFVGASQLPHQEEVSTAAHQRAAFDQLARTDAFLRLSPDARASLERAFVSILGDEGFHPSTLVGNLLNMLAARVAHELDFRGPAVAIDSACSSSLVAIHEACESLRRGECDLALAGGVSLNLTPSLYRFFEAAGALSPTGRCRAFSSSGDGFVPGEGAGFVLLRPLAAALEHGDPIHAVVRASAVNNDGRSIGVMAPNPEGQLAVLEAAYHRGKVEPATLGFVECHGTGTAIGDPIELKALDSFFRSRGARAVSVGSVKTNVGHLLGAAGIAGFIKAVLAVEHAMIPASLHATPVHPRLANHPFLRLQTELEPWPEVPTRRAGISSFGFGGTNCHVVIEQAPSPPPAAATPPFPGETLLTLSAPTKRHLKAFSSALSRHPGLASPTPHHVAGFARELREGRTTYAFRAARVLAKGEDPRPVLDAFDSGADGHWITGPSEGVRRPLRVAWLFPGQGAQSVAQSLGLFAGWPSFRKRMLELCGMTTYGSNLIDACYGPHADDTTLRRTDLAQPLIVGFQIAMSEALRDMGLTPSAVIGHSVGELSAACAAGALAPETAMRWAEQRGKLMQEQPATGGMLAVLTHAAEVERLIAPFSSRVHIAAYNAPDQVVIAASTELLPDVRLHFEAAGVTVLSVPVAHAFHSPHMEGAARSLASLLQGKPERPLAVPMISTVTAEEVSSEALGASYWQDQLRTPVRFAQAFLVLSRLPVDAFLEVGPGATLSGLGPRILPRQNRRPILSLCRKPGATDESADRIHALRTLGSLWSAGMPLSNVQGEPPPPLPRPQLPTIPFLEESHRLRPLPPPSSSTTHAQWTWTRTDMLPSPSVATGSTVVVLAGAHPRVAGLDERLRAAGMNPILVVHGETFSRTGQAEFRLDRGRADHCRWLLEALGQQPLTTLFLASDDDPSPTFQRCMTVLEHLATWTKAAGEQGIAARTHVITCDGQPVGTGPVRPDQAAVAAFSLAAFLEVPTLAGSVLDVASPLESHWDEVVAWLGRAPAPLVALRDGHGYARRLSPVSLPEGSWRDDGTYLLIGGAGGVGLHLARAIAGRPTHAKGARPTIILAGRRPEAALADALLLIRSEGADVSYRRADVLSPGQVEALVKASHEHHGRLDGVFLLAGAVAAGSVAGRDTATSNAILSSKVIGAENLSRALERVPCGFVVLMSSVAGSVPSLGKGLTDYAAANAFLDAFATRARRQGKPWTSIATSLWESTGLARLGSLPGTPALAPSTVAEQVLDAAAPPSPHVLILTARDAALATALPREHVHATYYETPSPSPAPTREQPPSPSHEEPDSLEAFLRTRIGQAIGLDAGSLDPDAPFQTLGLSSLAAVDLMKDIEERVGAKLSTALLFEHNTLSKLLANLPSASPAAFARHAANVAPTIESALPLLPAQQTFFANQAFYPDTPCYVFMRLDLEGPLDPGLLDKAIGILHQRHAMLRVTFNWEHDHPVQKPGTFPPPYVERFDLRGDPDPAQRLDSLEDEVRNQVFDLSVGPLFRVVACHTGETAWSLMFNIHHIVADAWSAQILVTELLTLHADLRAGRPPSLLPIRSDFARCAAEIENAGRGSDGAASAAYWTETLRHAPETLFLPFDGDPSLPTSGGCRILQDVLDEETTTGLEHLARRSGASTFQLVLTAYAWCLRQWTGQDDLIIRVANARREARVPDIERVVGSFADSLPVRLRLPSHAGLPAWLSAVCEAAVGAQAHPFTSSMQVAGMHGGRKHAGPKGVSPAGLSFPSFDAPTRYGELRVLGMRGGSASGFTQLGLIAWMFDGRLHLSWNYTRPLFRDETLRRLASECTRALSELAASGQLPRSRAPAQPHGSLPPGDVLHDRILRTAELSPDRTAVDDPRETITYGQLATRSLKIASVLADLGARVRVGILAHPGPDAIAGVLGILACGAAYVPVSPDYPDARIADILAHAAVDVLVFTRDQTERLGSLKAGITRALVLDSHARDCGVLPTALRALGSEAIDTAPPLDRRRVTGSDLAYVMYTSGTTGRPKGVMVRHAAVSLFHDWVHHAFGVNPADRFIQTSSLSFGGSIRQMFSPLLAGATVFPAPRDALKDPFLLVEFLDRHRITIWNSVPTLWMRLLDCVLQLDREGRSPALSALRWILIGGEHVPASNVRRWMDRFGLQHRIANLYGSTETVVNATWYEVPARPSDDAVHTPIGAARAGSEVLLLDDAGMPCPPGNVGSLFVGGPSLSDGYLHAPAETEQAFVRLPGRTGLYYRTGDLARADADGTLTYLGRSDTQVKVRGNRVELGEVEGVLGSHPSVAAAAVIEHTREDRQWLVAFLQPARPSERPEAAALRSHVAHRLPDYMIPHRFEWVDPLPLTAAGKIDRRALRLLADSDTTSPPAPDWTPTERTIAAVWSTLLEVPSVERDSDFFDLGGDSILALEMFQRLRGKVPALPRPITLYGARTVARLARAIDQTATLESTPKSSPAHGTEASESFPLSPSQESFVLAERVRGGDSVLWCARIPVHGALAPRTLEAAVTIATQRHPMLRAEVTRHGTATRQRWVDLDHAPLVFEDLHGLDETALEAVLQERFDGEQRVPFSLDTAPLWRMRVCLTGPHTSTWLLSIHHVIADGWSMQILGAEILAAYEALSHGQQPALPPLRTTFRDVVAHLAERRATVRPDDSRYWKTLFEKPWQRLVVPPGDDGITLSAALSGDQTAPLLRHARAAGVSLHTVVLTAWYRAVASLCETGDLVMGTATNGRDLPIDDVERLVGCFATGLPVRATVQGGPFLDDLHAVDAAYADACEHADMPIEDILRSAPGARDASTLPGSDTFFSFMDFHALPPIPGAKLDLRWEEGDYHFAAQVTSTTLMLGVMAGAGLRLHVHGRASRETKQRVLDAVVADLQGLEHAVAPEPVDGPRIDSAIIAYLPSDETLSPVLAHLGGSENGQWVDILLQGQRSRLVETTRSSLGVSGLVLLGRSSSQLPRMAPEHLAQEVADAVRLAGSHGARFVSLAGLLPSWTRYGHAVLDQLGADSPVSLSTGHGATVVAMVHAVRSLLRDLETSWSDLQVAVVGYGSIGQATVELLCDVEGPPRRVVVCDTAERLPLLGPSMDNLAAGAGCDVMPVASGATLPRDVYESDLILGASSEGGLVDTYRLAPGSVVVDDSFPPIVDAAAAMSRMDRKGDVVIISGGRLDVGACERTLRVPLPPSIAEHIVQLFDAGGVPGCRAESILLAAGLELPVIHGLVGREDARRYWDESGKVGVQAPAPRLMGQLVPERALLGVRALRARR